MPPTARKTPQDRKPKAPAGFTFEGLDGKVHGLPHPSAALQTLPGRALRDAMLGGDGEQVAFGLRCVEAVGADQSSLDALYDLPAPRMIEVIGQWMSSADLSEATLPQS